jgi:hypothetical protein
MQCLVCGPFHLILDNGYKGSFSGLNAFVQDDNHHANETTNFTLSFLTQHPRELFSTLPSVGASFSYLESDKTLAICTATFYVAIDWHTRSITASVAADDPSAQDMGFWNLINAVCGILAIKSGGMLMHCSSLYRGDKAIAFAAPSGGGKTTTASLLTPDWKIIGEDLNCIVPNGQIYVISRAPFERISLRRRTFNGLKCLTHVFFIGKGMRTAASELSLGRRVARVAMQCHSVPHIPVLSEMLFTNITVAAQRLRMMALTIEPGTFGPSFIDSILQE